MLLDVKKTLHEDPAGRTARVQYQDGLYLTVQYVSGKTLTNFLDKHTKRRRGQDVTDVSNEAEREFWLEKVVSFDGLHHEERDADGEPVLEDGKPIRYEIPYDPQSDVVKRLCTEANNKLREQGQKANLTPDTYLRWLLSQMWDNLGTEFRSFIRETCRELDHFRAAAR